MSSLSRAEIEIASKSSPTMNSSPNAAIIVTLVCTVTWTNLTSTTLATRTKHLFSARQSSRMTLI